MKAALQEFNIDEVLAQCPWFQELPGSALEKLAAAALIKGYAPHSYLYTIGEKSTELYCVLSGKIRIAINGSSGQEFAVTELESGSWTGEACLIGDEGRVLEASKVLVIPRNIIMAVGEEFPDMYRQLFIEHVKRTRLTYLLLGGMLFLSLRARLAGRVLELVEEHGKETEEGISLDIHMSQNDFARLSLGSRQRVNKIFRQWNEEGVIIVRNGKYLILDIDALYKEVEYDEF